MKETKNSLPTAGMSPEEVRAMCERHGARYPVSAGLPVTAAEAASAKRYMRIGKPEKVGSGRRMGYYQMVALREQAAKNALAKAKRIK